MEKVIEAVVEIDELMAEEEKQEKDGVDAAAMQVMEIIRDDDTEEIEFSSLGLEAETEEAEDMEASEV